MKIKILRGGHRGKWYHNTDNIGKEFRVNENDDKRFRTIGGYWVDKDDCVITELPESFCVKRCDDDKWKKYIKWFNRLSNKKGKYKGTVRLYYGFTDKNFEGDFSDKPFGTEIRIDDMIKHIDFYSEPMVLESEEDKMETQKLTRQGLKEIHSIACDNWKKALESWSKRNLFEDYIELSESEVRDMFDACSKEQKLIVSKYLKHTNYSIDIEKLNFTDNYLMEIRNSGEYKHKAFWLSDEYHWEIKIDSDEDICLIPTKKK